MKGTTRTSRRVETVHVAGTDLSYELLPAGLFTPVTAASTDELKPLSRRAVAAVVVAVVTTLLALTALFQVAATGRAADSRAKDIELAILTEMVLGSYSSGSPITTGPDADLVDDRRGTFAGTVVRADKATFTYCVEVPGTDHGILSPWHADTGTVYVTERGLATHC